MGTVGKGQILRAQALKGLWVRVSHRDNEQRERSCWLHGYDEEHGHVCDITFWDFSRFTRAEAAKRIEDASLVAGRARELATSWRRAVEGASDLMR